MVHEMFGKSSPPPPERDPEPAPDFRSLVERELRVADGAGDAERMWAPILASLQAHQRTLRYVYVRTRDR